MEKNIRKKVLLYTEDFKTNLQKWFQDNNATIFVDGAQDGQDKLNDFIQYMSDFPNIVIEKDDFQKRKRIKNNVPDYNRCIALKCNGERCSRKQKHSESQFCGTHIKGSPYGTIQEDSQQPKKQKVQLWLEEINGISRYIDKDYNVYSSEDIINSEPIPRIIGKYDINKETGKYFLVTN